MKPRTLITASALLALFSGPAWSFGCAVEPSAVNCTLGSNNPSYPIYSPPPRAYVPPPIYGGTVPNIYPQLPSYSPQPTSRCFARDVGQGRGYVVTCQ